MSDLERKQRKLLEMGIGPRELLHLVTEGPPEDNPDDISPLALDLAQGAAARLGLTTKEELEHLARMLEAHGAWKNAYSEEHCYGRPFAVSERTPIFSAFLPALRLLGL